MEVRGITAWLFSPKQMGMCWPGWQNGGSVVGLGIMVKKKKTKNKKLPFWEGEGGTGAAYDSPGWFLGCSKVWGSPQRGRPLVPMCSG